MTFYEKMRIVCLSIPAGKVATYGQIAMLCKKPRNSRQVGYGLKKNLAGEDIPAYRVVNSQGALSGACHFELPGLQKLLLQEEGVEVRWNGKNWYVDLDQYGWKTTLQEALEFEKRFREETT